MSVGDEEILLQTVTKLLDKAGRDPRLTPRILREKAEQRMSLNKGDLKNKREYIKDLIYEWWNKQKSAQQDKETSALKALVRLARLSGHVPAILKGVNELSTNAEKISILRERLRNKGLVFSDIPTETEIAAAEKAYKIKQDLDGIDENLIISSSRKRSSSDSKEINTTSTTTTTKTMKSNHGVVIKEEEQKTTIISSKSDPTTATVAAVIPAPKRPKIEYSDEEAEF